MTGSTAAEETWNMGRPVTGQAGAAGTARGSAHPPCTSGHGTVRKCGLSHGNMKVQLYCLKTSHILERVHLTRPAKSNYFLRQNNGEGKR